VTSALKSSRDAAGETDTLWRRYLLLPLCRHMAIRCGKNTAACLTVLHMTRFPDLLRRRSAGCATAAGDCADTVPFGHGLRRALGDLRAAAALLRHTAWTLALSLLGDVVNLLAT
jgi:hypothetical protein